MYAVDAVDSFFMYGRLEITGSVSFLLSKLLYISLYLWDHTKLYQEYQLDGQVAGQVQGGVGCYPAVCLVQEYQLDGQVAGQEQGGVGCQVQCQLEGQVQGQIEVESQVEGAVHG